MIKYRPLLLLLIATKLEGAGAPFENQALAALTTPGTPYGNGSIVWDAFRS